MKVSDLFRNLSYGELSNLSLSDQAAGTIKSDKQPQIVHFANLALKRLYVRFAHNRHYVNCLLSSNVTKYRMDPQYAVSNVDPTYTGHRHIQDSVADPFPGNLIKIVNLVEFTDDPDNPEVDLALNDTSLACTVRTTAYDTFMVDDPQDGQILEVECVLGHPPLSLPVDLNEEIHLAPVLHEALELYIAAKVYGSMNGEANHLKTQSLFQQYEAVCALAKTEDILQLTTTDTNNKLSDRGFV